MSLPLNVSSALKAPDTVHPGARRFIIDRKVLFHYCSSCAQIDWQPALFIHGPHSIGLLLSVRPFCPPDPPPPVNIHAAVSLGKLGGNDCLRSQEVVLLSVPEVQTELDGRAFKHSVTSARKSELNECELKELVSLGELIKTLSGLIMTCMFHVKRWFKA